MNEVLQSLKNHCGKVVAALLIGVFFSGCVSDDVTIRKVASSERFDYSSTMLQSYDKLMPASINILSNFLLNDLYCNHPERLLEKLEKLYLAEKHNIYIETLADCSFSLGRRFASNADTSADRKSVV